MQNNGLPQIDQIIPQICWIYEFQSSKLPVLTDNSVFAYTFSSNKITKWVIIDKELNSDSWILFSLERIKQAAKKGRKAKKV